MSILRTFFCTILVASSVGLLGQNGFVLEYEGKSHMQGKDLIETADNDFIVLAIVPNYDGNSTLIKLANDGEIMAEIPIGNTDTVPIMARIHRLDNSNLYVASGFVITIDNEEKYNAFQIHFNSDLQIIGQVFTLLPKKLEIFCTTIDDENNLIWVGSYRENNQWDIAIAKIDLFGNLINFTTHIREGNHFINDVFQLSSEPPVYGLSVSGPAEGSGGQGFEFFMQFGENLQYLQTTSIPHIVGFGNTSMAHVLGGRIAFAGKGYRPNKVMNNFTYIDAGDLAESVHDIKSSPMNNSVLVITDNTLTPENYLVFGDGQIKDFPAPYGAISFLDDNTIYTAGIKNIIPNEWPFQQEPSWIRVNKLDTELNIIWEKHFGGDAYYQVNCVTATSDGGVILSGFKTYPNQAPLMNLLVIKLKPDGTVSLDENPADERSSEISIFPNPASTWVAFNFALPVHVNEAVLQITDVHGRNITSFVINTKQGQQVWDIRDVKKGVYLYTLKAGIMSKNGKLIIN